MSATGRNLPGHERPENDFFRTPSWCTLAIWRELSRDPNVHRFDVLDAGCGDGAIMSALIRRRHEKVSGVEIDADLACRANENAKAAGEWAGSIERASYFASVLRRDLVIMNPPFSLAEEFVRHSLLHVAPRVVALLRLGFLESQERAALHREFPSDVYVLPSRPSFAHGKTDSSAYGWFCWGFGEGGRWSVLDVGDKAWRKANP